MDYVSIVVYGLEVPYVEEIYFEECCNCILSTVNAVFMQDRGETSFEDVYQVKMDVDN